VDLTRRLVALALALVAVVLGGYWLRRRIMRRGLAAPTDPKQKSDRWAFTLSVVALIISAAAVYIPYFYVRHDLTLMASDFQYDALLSHPPMMSVDLVFINKGNRHEAVLGAWFVLPISKDLSGRMWINALEHLRLAPFTLAPGQIVAKRLSQPASDDLILRFKKMNSDSSALSDDPAHQVVALQVVVLDPSGVRRSHVIPLGRTRTQVETLPGFFDYFPGTVALGGDACVDLLHGGKLGADFEPFSHYRFVTGDPTAAPDSS
jgi:hypothetical protein